MELVDTNNLDSFLSPAYSIRNLIRYTSPEVTSSYFQARGVYPDRTHPGWIVERRESSSEEREGFRETDRNEQQS